MAKPQLESDQNSVRCHATNLLCRPLSSFFLLGGKYVCFTHGLVFGYEKERLTAHLWAANEGVTLKKRGGGLRGGVEAA